NLHTVMRGDNDLRLAVAVHVVDDERRGVMAGQRAGGPEQLALVGAFVEGKAVALAVAGVHAARKRYDLQAAAVREQFGDADVAAERPAGDGVGPEQLAGEVGDADRLAVETVPLGPS